MKLMVLNGVIDKSVNEGKLLVMKVELRIVVEIRGFLFEFGFW